MTAQAIRRAENGEDVLTREQLSAIERTLTAAGIEFRHNSLPVLKRQPLDPQKKTRVWISVLTTKSFFHEEFWVALLLV
jgi:hypothetical protein